MKGKKYGLQFGNCVECNAYQLVDRDGLCNSCMDEERTLIDQACRYMQKHPHATREELAEALQVSLTRVNRWLKHRRIHCIAMRAVCPECGKELINTFECECQKNKFPSKNTDKKKSQRIVYLDYQKKRREKFTRPSRRSRRRIYSPLSS